jgi:hypothetical protein
VKFFNRVRVFSSTASGAVAASLSINLGSRYNSLFLTAAEAGAVNTDVTSIVIEQGTDFAICNVTIGASATSCVVNSVEKTRVGDVAGATLTLDGTQAIRFVESAADLNAILARLDAIETNAVRFDTAQSKTAAQKDQARQNAGVPGKNYLLNPSGDVNQFPAGSQANATWSFDQWYVLTQSNPITASQLSAVEAGLPKMMRFSQANASAQRFGVIQWLENSAANDLISQSVALSARVRMSASTTLRYAILEWTGTADTITKDVVNSWTNGTFTAGQFFKSTGMVVTATGSIALTANTLTDITALIGTVGATMQNLAVMFWTDSTQAQNVTLDIGKVKLEQGTLATPFVRDRFRDQLRQCQRFWEKSYGYLVAPGTAATVNGTTIDGVSSNTVTNSQQYGSHTFAEPKRISPAMTIYSYNGTSGRVSDDTGTDLAAGSGGAFWVGEEQFSAYNTSGGSITTTGTVVLFNWVADARL